MLFFLCFRSASVGQATVIITETETAETVEEHKQNIKKPN